VFFKPTRTIQSATLTPDLSLGLKELWTMLKLTEVELEAGLDAIKHHGYSDFFPTPPEFDVVVKSWPGFKKYLADLDLDEYKAYRPSLELSAPKSVINLRRGNPSASFRPNRFHVYCENPSRRHRSSENRRKRKSSIFVSSEGCGNKGTL